MDNTDRIRVPCSLRLIIRRGRRTRRTGILLDVLLNQHANTSPSKSHSSFGRLTPWFSFA